MKLALITGCSSGFGKAMVGDLLQEGWTVIATMRGERDRSEAVFANEIKKFSNQLDLQCLDITSQQDIDNIAALIKNKYQAKIDLLVNNAGFAVYGPFEGMEESQIRRQMEVNFFGTVLLTQKIIPYLRSSKKGQIVFVSSIMGQCSMPLSSMYSASKFALEGFVESLYYELKSQNIEVCSLQPGGHKTQFMKSAVLVKSTKNYEKLQSGFLDFIKEVQSKKVSNKNSSQKVSSVMSQILRKNKLPRTQLVGGDAKALAFLKWLLPESIYMGLTNFLYVKKLRG